MSNQWIDIDEKRPSKQGDYLIQDYQGRVALGKYRNGFYMETGGEKWGMVKYWAELPQTPNLDDQTN